MSVIQKYDAEKKQLVISINGSFNFEQHGEFREAYRHIPADKNLQVSVDLRNTDYMDSAALGMLLLLDEHFNGQPIHIINCSDYIRQVLDIANFSKKFRIS